jgi:hypothetical protein
VHARDAAVEDSSGDVVLFHISQVVEKFLWEWFEAN